MSGFLNRLAVLTRIFDARGRKGSASTRACQNDILCAMRLFIGIGVPNPVGHRLSSAARNQVMPEGTRWTTPSNMHVTLSFPGNVEQALLEQIQLRLSTIQADRFRIEMTGLGVFAHAGILMASVKPSTALGNLAERVNVAMESCGIPREQRAYSPHVTLARFKGRFFFQPSDEVNRAFFQTFEALEFRLYESFTRPEGAQYVVLNCFALRWGALSKIAL